MSTRFFRRQLGIYSSYHRDERNRATHFIGIPAIVFSLLMALALWRFRLVGHDVSAAWVVAIVAVAVFFVGGWVFQLVGHVWEGKRPALADNLFQAFIGPMFIMAEVLMALGLKQDLKAVIDGAPHAPA